MKAVAVAQLVLNSARALEGDRQLEKTLEIRVAFHPRLHTVRCTASWGVFPFLPVACLATPTFVWFDAVFFTGARWT